jgi:hypothetical protein
MSLLMSHDTTGTERVVCDNRRTTRWDHPADDAFRVVPVYRARFFGHKVVVKRPP